MGLVGSGVGIACEAGVKSTGRTKWLKGPEEVTSAVDDKSSTADQKGQLQSKKKNSHESPIQPLSSSDEITSSTETDSVKNTIGTTKGWT